MIYKSYTLDELCIFIRNGKSVKQSKDVDGLPITRIETIANQTIDSDRVGYAGLTEEEGKSHLLECGDILFSHINSLEHLCKTAIYTGFPKKLVHGMNLLCIRPNPQLIFPQYLLHLLRSSRIRASLLQFANKSVNQASISAGNLKSFVVNIPPLAEQRRIASILDQADELRQKRQQAIEKLDQLLQATFIDMFGDPVSNPKGWDLVKVGEVVDEFIGGKNIECPDESDSDYKILKVSAVTSKVYKPNESKFAPNTFEPNPLAIVEKGDLLFSRANTTELVAATAYVWETPENIVLPDKLWKFSISDESKLNKLYLWDLFKNIEFRNELSKLSSGTSGSMKNISKGKLNELKMPLPPKELQDKFAEFSTNLWKQIKTFQQSSDSFDSLFKSLQNQAFNGTL